MIELLLGGLAALGTMNRAQSAPRTSGPQGRAATPLADGNTFYPSVTTQDREDPAVAPFENYIDELSERRESAVNVIKSRTTPIFENIAQINRNDLIQQMNPISTTAIRTNALRDAPAPIISKGLGKASTPAPASRTYEPPRRPATVITEDKGWRRPEITIPRREDQTGPNTTVRGVIDGMPTTPRWEPPIKQPTGIIIPRIRDRTSDEIRVDNRPLQRTPDAPDPQWVSPELEPVVAEAGGGPGAIEFESGPAPTAPIQPIPVTTTGLNIVEGRVTTPAIDSLPTFERRRAETHSALNNARASLKNSVDAVRESAANLTPKATPTAAPTDSEIDMWLRENDFMSRFY